MSNFDEDRRTITSHVHNAITSKMTFKQLRSVLESLGYTVSFSESRQMTVGKGDVPIIGSWNI